MSTISFQLKMFQVLLSKEGVTFGNIISQVTKEAL